MTRERKRCICDGKVIEGKGKTELSKEVSGKRGRVKLEFEEKFKDRCIDFAGVHDNSLKITEQEPHHPSIIFSSLS